MGPRQIDNCFNIPGKSLWKILLGAFQSLRGVELPVTIIDNNKFIQSGVLEPPSIGNTHDRKGQKMFFTGPKGERRRFPTPVIIICRVVMFRQKRQCIVPTDMQDHDIRFIGLVFKNVMCGQFGCSRRRKCTVYNLSPEATPSKDGFQLAGLGLIVGFRALSPSCRPTKGQNPEPIRRRCIGKFRSPIPS